MPLHWGPDSVQQREPDVGERRVIGEHNVLPELDVCRAPSQNCRAIVQVMDRADVASVGEGNVVEERATVDFLGGF